MTEEKVRFATAPDFELGLEHCSRETDYFIVHPEQAAKGLVVYVPGFGEDAGEYRHVFCQKVAEKFGLAAMSVDYHCFYSRSQADEAIVYEPEDIALIEKIFMRYELPFSGNSVEEGVAHLNTHLAKKKQSVEITATLKPGKDEYQNGGVLQALDIINAVIHALDHYQIPEENVILVGSSYGGYIANLATKFAPKTFRAVFDNSSWATPHFGYIVGREHGFSELSRCRHTHIQTNFYLRTAWTLKKGLPNTFDGKRFHVRSFSKEQVDYFADYQPETYYFFIHAQNDTIASTEDKIQMAKELMRHNINVHMEVIEPADVDGQYVKTIKHGMNLSMLTFFDKTYADLGDYQISIDNDYRQKSKIRYPSSECIYEFDFSAYPVNGRVLQRGRE